MIKKILLVILCAQGTIHASAPQIVQSQFKKDQIIRIGSYGYGIVISLPGDTLLVKLSNGKHASFHLSNPCLGSIDEKQLSELKLDGSLDLLENNL